MKRNLLLLFILMIGIGTYAQDGIKATMPDAIKSTELIEVPVYQDLDGFSFWHANNHFLQSSLLEVTEYSIGESWYDMQTNSSMGGRIHLHPDGTVGAVWTKGLEGEQPDWPSRGTGYNYYDGGEWGPMPTQRVEAVRTGWPQYAPWGPNGEIIVSHQALDGNFALIFSTRENKGTGDWTSFDYPGTLIGEVQPTWPRITTSGENNEIIHLIYNSYVPDDAQMVYYNRSLDGGETWEEEMILEGMGPDDYTAISADYYTLTSLGSTVVIFHNDRLTDAFFMKSMDDGETWEKTVVWEHPIEFFDFDNPEHVTDSMFWTPNGAGDATIGPDGKVHVVFAITCWGNTDPGSGSITVWTGYGIDGIAYWNEDMEMLGGEGSSFQSLAAPIQEEPTSQMVEDYNFIGWTQDVDGDGQIDMESDKILQYRCRGTSSWPNIIADDNGDLFITYASPTETYTNFDFYYRKIWARAFANGSWGPFLHVTEPFIHIFDESVFPSLSKTSDNNIHLLYQNDGEPGYYMNPATAGPDHDPVMNSMIHSMIPKTDLLTHITESSQVINSASVTQNFPNPCTDFTTLSVYLGQGSDLSLEITNLIGQKVFAQERGTVSKGTYHFTIDVTSYETGIYFYTVKAGNSSVTKKMIVQ